MVFYAAAYRHVPVSWIVALCNLFSSIFGIFSWTGERIWSFLNAIWYNIAGFDKYFIFMDRSPVPIPYCYYGGTPGHAAWLYDARNKTFTYCVDEGKNKKEHLPVLAMDLIARRRDQFEEWELSGWLENVTFYTHDEQFPHPLQLLSAWSLESKWWPATHAHSQSRFIVIDSTTADTLQIELRQFVEPFEWYKYATEYDDSEKEETTEEDTTEEETTEEETTQEETTEEETTQEETTEEETTQEETTEEETTQEETTEEETTEEEDHLLTESQSTETETPPNSIASDDYVRDMEAVD